MSQPKETVTTHFGPEGHRILPIQIREDLIVYIQDLPHDLTQSEAQKISNVIEAHHV
jgi:hypothetical protein